MSTTNQAPQHHGANLDFSKRLLAWYDVNHRSLPWRIPPYAQGVQPSPYRTWISEIMLQQTGAVTVGPYFQRFLESFPTMQDLADASIDRVLVHWQGLGYYRRAKNLHQAAKIMAQQGVPQNYEEWLALPGIGAYTAAAITAIAQDKPAVAVDVNIRRVLSRYFALDGPQWIQQVWKTAAQALPESRWGDYTQALMDLGATICRTRNPLCSQCPLIDGCKAAASGTPTHWPPKILKMVKKKWLGHVYLVFSGACPNGSSNSIWMHEGKEGDLLSGLWRFPGSEWAETLPDHPLLPKVVPAGRVHHAFTHIALTLQVWIVSSQEDMREIHPQWQENGQWISIEAMAQYPVSTLMKKVLKQALQHFDAAEETLV
jgi:A/G-specific adenine glycosylase